MSRVVGRGGGAGEMAAAAGDGDVDPRATTVVQVAAGEAHSLALTGAVWFAKMVDFHYFLLPPDLWGASSSCNGYAFLNSF